jgi:hypothetical protein
MALVGAALYLGYTLPIIRTGQSQKANKSGLMLLLASWVRL